jgi:hypothetical protein
MQRQQGLTYHQCQLEDQEFNKSYLLDMIVFYDRILSKIFLLEFNESLYSSRGDMATTSIYLHNFRKMYIQSLYHVIFLKLNYIILSHKYGK